MTKGVGVGDNPTVGASTSDDSGAPANQLPGPAKVDVPAAQSISFASILPLLILLGVIIFLIVILL